MNKTLVTLPNSDLTTQYLACWASEVICEFEPSIYLLDGERSDRTTVESFLKKRNIDFVWFNGHGSNSVICGYDNMKLIEENVNDKLLSGKICYSLSCNSAKSLGVSAVNKKCKAFIGYKAPFVFLTDKNKECTPEKDEIGSIFMTPSNIIPRSILKGKTVKQAYDKSQRVYRSLINKYSASDAIPEAPYIREALFWNMFSQKLIGNIKAKI